MPFTSISNTLKKKSFQEALKNALYLLKYSFVLIGKNTGIVRPTVYLSLLSLLMTALFFTAMACFISGRNIPLGLIAILLLV
jgi:hypothetical protein